MEAGPHTHNVPNHIQPGRFYRSLTRTETFSHHVAKPSPALCDRSVIVTTGRAMGGGSSINSMKAIFVINAKTQVMICELKLLCTQGRRPRITTIGKTYMGTKRGVLSI